LLLPTASRSLIATKTYLQCSLFVAISTTHVSVWKNGSNYAPVEISYRTADIYIIMMESGGSFIKFNMLAWSGVIGLENDKVTMSAPSVAHHIRCRSTIVRLMTSLFGDASWLYCPGCIVYIAQDAIQYPIYAHSSTKKKAMLLTSRWPYFSRSSPTSANSLLAKSIEYLKIIPLVS
jgi:hypothetical protein